MSDVPKMPTPVASGPVRKALVKGLAIVLPALITIAIFAWAWGIVRDYGVKSIIKGLDEAKVFSAPEDLVASKELLATASPKNTPLEPGGAPWETPEGLIYVLDENKVGHVYLRAERSYSILAIGSAYTDAQREYDSGTGRIESYTTFEYVTAIILTVIIIILLGLLARAYFGKHMVAVFDRFFNRIPIIKMVYPYAKQVVDFFFSEQTQIKFDKVVAVEYPRDGCWQIGFVTGPGMKSLSRGTGTRHTTVFVPMSPIPMTGFTVFVPDEQVQPLDVSVEDACMIILSGGVLTPPAQMMSQESDRMRDWEKRINAARSEVSRLMKSTDSSIITPDVIKDAEKADKKKDN